jgi:hypothetical protein
MKKETFQVRTLEPSDGMALKHITKNTVHFGIVYLAKDAKEEDYIEITIKEAEDIREEQKAELKAKMTKQ